jgi:hypothetical protein
MKWAIRTLPFLISGALAIVDLSIFNESKFLFFLIQYNNIKITFLYKRCRIFLFFLTKNNNNEKYHDADITKPEDCPKVQYACPYCPQGQQCVYPNSGGCEGAGIPTCQAVKGCFGIVCLMRALPW